MRVRGNEGGGGGGTGVHAVRTRTWGLVQATPRSCTPPPRAKAHAQPDMKSNPCTRLGFFLGAAKCCRWHGGRPPLGGTTPSGEGRAPRPDPPWNGRARARRAHAAPFRSTQSRPRRHHKQRIFRALTLVLVVALVGALWRLGKRQRGGGSQNQERCPHFFLGHSLLPRSGRGPALRHTHGAGHGSEAAGLACRQEIFAVLPPNYWYGVLPLRTV